MEGGFALPRQILSLVIAAVEVAGEVVLDGFELIQPVLVFRRLFLAARLQFIKQCLVAKLVVLQKGEVELVVPLGDFIRQLEDTRQIHGDRFQAFRFGRSSIAFLSVPSTSTL